MERSKRIFGVSVALLLAVSLLAGCGGPKVDQLAAKPAKGQQIATIKVKDYGDIKVMLFPEVAPKGVENFVTHAKDGYYDGVKFHRVVQDFMIQGGDPEGTGRGGESIWGKPFETEFDGALHNYTGALCYANAGKDTNGSQFYIVDAPPVTADTVSQMKKFNQQLQTLIDQNPDQKSAIEAQYGAPFQIDDAAWANYEKIGGAPSLDNGAYTVFGQVYEGLDVVSKIMQCDTTMGPSQEKSVPVPDIVIETIEVGVYDE